MSTEKRAPIRFGLLTALIWLLVAGGIIFLLWKVIGRISATDLPPGTSTPDETQLAQTIAAIVDAQASGTASILTPTASPSVTAVPSQITSTALPPPKITPTPIQVTQTTTPTALCDQAGAGNPIDVTIPDDSVIPAGQSFVKTWKLENIGTCTWTTAYSATFFYGDRMGASESVPLKGYVSPSQNVEISVEMVAPQTPGTYQGNWKLENPDGALFGIGPGGNNPFWVRIVVEQNLATPSSTPTLSISTTPTETPTATTTPTGQVGGELSAIPGDKIDLDTLRLNQGDEDLAYVADENGYHWLSPQSTALIGVYGTSEPTLVNCEAAVMSPAPIAVESLPAGTFLCYSTNQGRYGRVLLVARDPDDFTLTLNLLTWALP